MQRVDVCACVRLCVRSISCDPPLAHRWLNPTSTVQRAGEGHTHRAQATDGTEGIIAKQTAWHEEGRGPCVCLG